MPFLSSWLTIRSVVLLGFIIAGCSEENITPASQGKKENQGPVLKSRKLVVLTRNAPTTYYIGREGPMGFEYDLLKAFSKSLGLRLEIRKIESIAALLEAIRKEEGDIAAAGLTRIPEREKYLLFGPTYHRVHQQVVCHRDAKRPRSIKDLPRFKILIIKKSSYEARLRELKKRFPNLTWKTTEKLDTEEILFRVWRKKVDCTVADSNIVAVNRRYFPELTVAFAITEPQPLAWALPVQRVGLHKAIKAWFAKRAQKRRLRVVRDRYYSFVEIFDYVDLKVYHRRIRRRLPRVRWLFQRAAKRYGFSWTLLAAVSYQESHWDPKAKSPTGVQGLMMLTRTTARELGVRNCLSPTQSVMGGARYLRKLKESIPSSVRAPDRMWFSLAAYNMGMGHLRDARTLAKRLGKDPNLWRDVRAVLPLLARKKYFRKLKYGYARGTEAVRYVRRIRNYQDILHVKHKSRS